MSGDAQPAEAKAEATSEPKVDAAALRAEEASRLATIAAAAPLMLLFAPFIAPLYRGRSIYDEVKREPLEAALFAAILLWPAALGAVGLVKGLRRRAPGKVASAVLLVLQALMTLAVSALIAYAISDRRRHQEDPLLWLAVLAGLAGLVVAVRGFWRAGFRRWTSLLAAVWLYYLQLGLVITSGEGYSFERPELGAWLGLFALAMLGPISLHAVWTGRRRGARAGAGAPLNPA